MALPRHLYYRVLPSPPLAATVEVSQAIPDSDDLDAALRVIAKKNRRRVFADLDADRRIVLRGERGGVLYVSRTPVADHAVGLRNATTRIIGEGAAVEAAVRTGDLARAIRAARATGKHGQCWASSTLARDLARVQVRIVAVCDPRGRVAAWVTELVETADCPATPVYSVVEKACTLAGQVTESAYAVPGVRAQWLQDEGGDCRPGNYPLLAHERAVPLRSMLLLLAALRRAHAAAFGELPDERDALFATFRPESLPEWLYPGVVRVASVDEILAVLALVDAGQTSAARDLSRRLRSAYGALKREHIEGPSAGIFTDWIVCPHREPLRG